MKKAIFSLIIFLVFVSCSNKKIPNVSDIKVDIKQERFEQDFFQIDTNNLSASIELLKKKYPQFTQDFIYNILGLPTDSILIEGQYAEAFKQFIHDYTYIKDSSDKIYKDFSKPFDEIKGALKFVKYYFPDYHLPKKVITFIGPMDAFFQTSFGTQGDVLTSEGLAIGLQLHLGKSFSFYNSDIGQNLYPAYISANFDEAHIPVNCMKNIVDDMFPPSVKSATLIEQMVERGRRLYLLTSFLPRTKDAIIMGYSDDQMKSVNKNEGVIWDFFLSNNLLNSADQNITKNYVGESPKTQEFGEDAPGNLGSFSGLQIVRKYMEKFSQTTLPELMRLEPRDIYERSKYKPKS